jgi:sulfatase modifying factor 1
LNRHRSCLGPLKVLVVLLATSLVAACVREHCYADSDCASPQLCTSGVCAIPECGETLPCGAGLECVANHCQPIARQPLACPAGMVSVADAFCADTYEASRPDATATGAGNDGSRAVSAAGVLPWQVADNATAERACGAAGKRLCSADEWHLACTGPDGTVYSYGDAYQPTMCNGIDAFGRSSFRLAPTGAFAGCTNAWGLFDINGNLWEHVAGGNDTTVRGGAYNCNDSAALHKCDYVPGNWTPSARGFRCCLTPSGLPDGGSAPDAAHPLDALAAAAEAGSCVDDAAAKVPPDAVDAGVPASDGSEERLEVAESDVPVALDSPASDDLSVPGPDDGPSACPPEMALVGDVCVDRYEASRQDATATKAGTDDGVACSRAGVLPWYVNPMSAAMLEKFQAACQSAGKRLCTADEWNDTCRGPEQTTYVFGNDWDASVCNSVDTHCQRCCEILGLSSCPSGENCGYASELSSSYTPETCFVSADYGKDTCHVCFHVMPTGSFPRCTNGSGLFDVNGNVWEVVPVPTSQDSRGYEIRGGAFNCGSPAARFRCDFNAGWNDLYAGFRCCKARAS